MPVVPTWDRAKTPEVDFVDLLGLEPGMTVAAIGAAAGSLHSSIAEVIGNTGQVHRISAVSPSPLHNDSCDRVVAMNLTSPELGDPLTALHEAKRLLRGDGRLIVIEWGSDGRGRAFREMVRLLEFNTWSIHRHLADGPYHYLLEAAV